MTRRSPRFSPYRALATRRWRRRLVLGAYAGYLVYLASLAFSYPYLTDEWFYAVRLPIFILVAGCYFLLHRVTRETALRPDWELDEREDRIRAQAYRTAYRILAVLMVPPIAYTLLAVDRRATLLAAPRGDILSEVFIFLVLMMLTLPTSVVAWIEPDPLDEDDAADDGWAADAAPHLTSTR